jgi:hypothetical protein
MKKFSVLVAHDVPHYGVVDIEAESADRALEILMDRPLDETLDEACNDPAYENSICARVVYIRDENDNCSHEDTPLDNSYREWGAIGELIEACNAALLREDIADGELGDKLRAALAAAGIPSNEVMKLTSLRRPDEMLDALDGCIEQMAQCENLLPDDREFTAALTAARAARSKAGAA